MPPTDEALNRLVQDMRLETPLVTVCDAAPSPEFEEMLPDSSLARPAPPR